MKWYLSIHPENVHLCVIFVVNLKTNTTNLAHVRHWSPFVLPNQYPSSEGICYWLGRCSLLPHWECSFMADPQLQSYLTNCTSRCCASAFSCGWGVVGRLQCSSLLRLQPERRRCTIPNLATWKEQRNPVHRSPLQAVSHRAERRWFAGRMHQLQALGIMWIQPVTPRTSNAVIRDSFSSSSVIV